MFKLFGRSNVKLVVQRLLGDAIPVKDRVVIDIPAGRGEMTSILRQKGARVEAYDLFPESFHVDGVECRRANLLEPLPIAGNHADLVLCEEGVEHLPDPLTPFREFHRILRAGGRLLITTPSLSSLRARLGYLLVENEFCDRLPPTRSDAVRASTDSGTYFGHIFLMGAQRMRIIAEVAGFRLVRVHAGKTSAMSVLLGLPLWPVLALWNLYAYYATLRALRKRGSSADAERYWEIMKLNVHPAILFGKKLILEFEKLAGEGG